MGKVYVVGIGPGCEEMMTSQVRETLDQCDVIAGYTTYVNLLSEELKYKKIITTGMRQERERCEMCANCAKNGENVALVCSGDAGVYGMASLMIEVAADYENVDVEVLPGVTAALSGAALLGAPIGHDFCVISLSDLLTPWEKIECRLRMAAEADFAIVLYNPASKNRPDHLKKACNILMEKIDGNRLCGYAVNIGRENENYELCKLEELSNAPIDMFTTVFIGNSLSREIGGRMVTPRGYLL